MASRTLPAAPRHLRLVHDAEAAIAGRRATSSRRNVALLLVPSAALTIVGIVMVFSASSVAAFAQYGSSTLFFKRQVAYSIVGAAALVVTARLRYTAWQRLAPPFLGATALLLLVVLRAGTSVAGAARWISLGPVTFQPSELAKLALVTFAATILARKWNHLDDLAHLALPLVPVCAIVFGLVIMQPDLGTTVILAGTVFLMLFVAGVRMRYLTISALTGFGLGMALILTEPYRRARFLSFIDPWASPKGSGWQLTQSLIALGSGGWSGVGLGASLQKWLFLPNAHTDFIFAILGEELGLIGELVVLALFATLVYAGIRIALRAPDVFGRLLAAGIVSWLGLQTIVNLGAVTGLLPVTGVPLPLVSFGGSSLVVTLASIGILVNIARSSPKGRRAPTARRQAKGRAR